MKHKKNNLGKAEVSEFIKKSDLRYKHKSYEIVDNIDGEPCITPSDDNDFEEYKLSDFFNTAYLDFIKLGQHLYSNLPTIDDVNMNYIDHKEDIINFVSKYGLFNLFTFNIDTMYTIDNITYVLPIDKPAPDQNGKMQMIPMNKFARRYLCSEKPIHHHELLTPKAQHGKLPENHWQFKYYRYGEPIRDLILNFLNYYYQIHSLIEIIQYKIDPWEYEYIDTELGNFTVYAADDVFATLRMNNFAMSVVYVNNSWKPIYISDFLLDNLLLITIEKITTGKGVVKCKSCGRLEIRRHPNQIYCSKATVKNYKFGEEGDYIVEEGEDYDYQIKYKDCAEKSRQEKDRERKFTALNMIKRGKDLNTVATDSSISLERANKLNKVLKLHEKGFTAQEIADNVNYSYRSIIDLIRQINKLKQQ